MHGVRSCHLVRVLFRSLSRRENAGRDQLTAPATRADASQAPSHPTADRGRPATHLRCTLPAQLVAALTFTHHPPSRAELTNACRDTAVAHRSRRRVVGRGNRRATAGEREFGALTPEPTPLSPKAKAAACRNHINATRYDVYEWRVRPTRTVPLRTTDRPKQNTVIFIMDRLYASMNYAAAHCGANCTLVTLRTALERRANSESHVALRYNRRMLPDPNWFYSSLAQSGAAIIGVVGAVAVARLQQQLAAIRSARYDLDTATDQLSAELHRVADIFKNYESWAAEAVCNLE